MSVAVSEACSKVCPQRGFYTPIVILAGQELYQVAPLRDTSSAQCHCFQNINLLLFFEDTGPLKWAYYVYTYHTSSQCVQFTLYLHCTEHSSAQQWINHFRTVTLSSPLEVVHWITGEVYVGLWQGSSINSININSISINITTSITRALQWLVQEVVHWITREVYVRLCQGIRCRGSYGTSRYIGWDIW